MALTGGQVTVSGTAQALTASGVSVETLVLKAHSTNAASVYVGATGVTSSTGYPIAAGEEFIIAPAHGNLNRTEKPKDIYVVGTASDKVSWIGTQK